MGSCLRPPRRSRVFSAVYVVARVDLPLAMVALAISPPLFLLTWNYRRRMRSQYRHAKRLDSNAMAVVQEALAALRVVKAFSREDSELERFTRRSRAGVRARVGLARAEGVFGLSVSLVTAVGTAAVLFIGTRHVQSGSLTLGDLLLVIAYLGQLYSPLRTMSKKAATLQSAWASAERVFDFLDEAPEVAERPHARRLDRASGAVEFDHVSMSYGNGREVLRDVCLRVPPGSRIGIKGATGAGKTTLVHLLARFYDPTEGRILLDGVDVREYTLAGLRHQLAFALQEPVLFSTSIAENISYARPGADIEDVEEAARQAHADEFIRTLPEGYDTLVGERGMLLSGGERQRISLARAFLKDGSVLILDEPTSSVDAATEALIMDAVERLTTRHTTFVIAHRPSTLEWCDAWVELDHGRIVRAGGRITTNRRPRVPAMRDPTQSLGSRP